MKVVDFMADLFDDSFVFVLFYSYGSHHVEVNISYNDFVRVRDDLSKEFTILQIDLVDEPYIYFDFCFINYHGDLETFARVFPK